MINILTVDDLEEYKKAIDRMNTAAAELKLVASYAKEILDEYKKIPTKFKRQKR